MTVTCMIIREHERCAFNQRLKRSCFARVYIMYEYRSRCIYLRQYILYKSKMYVL